jgi:molybdopterin synthase sulfur carrier subunit
MRIVVIAFANFREILGKERQLKARDGATVGELLETLAASSQAFREAAFDDGGALRDYVLLMINRKRIDPAQELFRQLQDGDELAIFPPLAGG